MSKKTIKDSLSHLNDCYESFKQEAKNKNITLENEKEYINLLLKNYINSDYIIDTKKLKI